MQGRRKYIENNNNFTFDDDWEIIRVTKDYKCLENRKTKARIRVANYIQGREIYR